MFELNLRDRMSVEAQICMQALWIDDFEPISKFLTAPQTNLCNANSPLGWVLDRWGQPLSTRTSHLRKLLIRVRFALATHIITAASSTIPSTGIESGMRSNGLTK